MSTPPTPPAPPAPEPAAPASTPPRPSSLIPTTPEQRAALAEALRANIRHARSARARGKPVPMEILAEFFPSSAPGSVWLS